MAKFGIASTDETDRGDFTQINNILEEIGGPAQIKISDQNPYVIVYSTEFGTMDMDTLSGYCREDDFPDEEISRICFSMTPNVAKEYLQKKWKERIEEEKKEAASVGGRVRKLLSKAVTEDIDYLVSEQLDRSSNQRVTLKGLASQFEEAASIIRKELAR